MTEHRTADVYLCVQPDRYMRRECRVIKATQSEPTTTPPGAVVVKLRLRVPAAAFRPLIAATDVEVPVELVQPVAVEAVEP